MFCLSRYAKFPDSTFTNVIHEIFSIFKFLTLNNSRQERKLAI